MMNMAAKVQVDNLQEGFDVSSLTRGVRGKHLARYRSGTNLVLLAPDVAAAFPSEEAVNKAHRSLIKLAADSESPIP